MSALLSRVARHRARLFRTPQSTNVNITTRAYVALYTGVSRPRHTPVPSRALPLAASLHDVFGKPFSLLTTANSAEEQKKPSEIVRSKTEWMQQSAAKGDHATVLRAVYDCYKPLYATHPLLIGKESLLSTTAASGAAATSGETPFQPVEYDDVETQLTEKVALALFRLHGQLELALAVLKHREWIAATVENAPLANGALVNSGRHIPALLSEAMRTHYSLRDYAQAESIYDQAIHQGVPPTSEMTCAYIDTLVSSKQFTKALAVWGEVQQEMSFVEKHTLQSMLYVARTTHNPALATHVMDLVESKGFELDVKSYVHAMLSFDNEYYYNAQEEEDSSAGVPELRSLCTEDYFNCTRRITQQQADPDQYASIEAASLQVLKLFDDMVETTTSNPLQLKKLLPRVMAAAMFLGQCDKIAAYTAQYHDVIAKVMDPIVIRIATNALLVQHQPVAAWELVLDMYGKALDDPLASTSPQREVGVNTLRHVVQYLRINKQPPNVKKLLVLLADQGRLPSALSTPSSLDAMITLMLKTADTANDDLWQLVVVDYAQLFPVLTDAKFWMEFVKAYARLGQWPLVSKAIQSRDKTQLPRIAPWLASFAKKQVLTSKTPYFAYLQLLAQLPDLVVESGDDSMSDADKISLACNAIYALDVLQQQKQQQQQQQTGPGDWTLDILRLHAQYLSGAPVAKIPTKVQEIVKRAQE